MIALALSVVCAVACAWLIKRERDRIFWRTMRVFSSLTVEERRALLRAVSKLED